MIRQAESGQQGSVGYWVFRLHRAMVSELNAYLANFGLTGAEYSLLSQLYGGECTPLQLAERMRIDRAAVSRLLAGLEQAKRVRRKAHRTDRRSSLVAMTATCRAEWREIAGGAMRINKRFLVCLSDKESQTLLTLLRTVVNSAPETLYSIQDCKR